jgi:hypothetical protein
VSKKTGQRRGGAASAAGARGTAAAAQRGDAPATASAQARAGRRADAAQQEASAVVERLLGRLLTAVAAGDPLKAELETSIFMAIPYATGKADPDQVEAFIAKVLVDGAVQMRTPDGAALLRLLASLGSPATKRAASQGLGRLTQAGIYPPDWVTGAGKAVPGRAWRRYDVFGDHEAVAVTFSYGEAEHAIVAQVDLTGMPTVVMVGVTPDPADVIEGLTRDDEELERSETISLAEARRRLEEPLARCEDDPVEGTGAATNVFLPVARSRVRRLPADNVPRPERVFGAPQRAAAVDEFLRSPLAAEAVAADEAATRFWAEVLTGYSGRVFDEPPAQVGPRKLTYILLGHVPNVFALTPAQRQHLEPAVTAWTRWSAAHRGLDDAATERLTERLPGVFSRFDQAYDDPDAALSRSYMADLVAGDVDVSWLTEQVARRMFAVPMAEPGDGAPRDAGDPQVRRAVIEAEFADCAPPAGMTREQFVTAVHRVVSEIWDGDPFDTFWSAQDLVAGGLGRHDAIHALAERAASSAGR